MREAKVNGLLMLAGPDAPEVATCPICEGAVQKRKRRQSDGGVTWFWRHRSGEGDGCPRRYSPNGD